MREIGSSDEAERNARINGIQFLKRISFLHLFNRSLSLMHGRCYITTYTVELIFEHGSIARKRIPIVAYLTYGKIRRCECISRRSVNLGNFAKIYQFREYLSSCRIRKMR